MIRMWLAVPMGLWVGITGVAAAAPSPTTMRSPTASQELRVCLGPAQDVTRLPGGKSLLITCPAHTTLASLPALFAAECDRRSGPWQCKRPVLAVRAPVGARSVLLGTRGGSFELARDIAKTLVDHPWHFNGRDLAEMLQGLCIVSDLGRGAFPGARDFQVRCGKRGMVVTRACAQDACRMFPARWDDEA